jgi:hypothetical protein
MIFDLSYIYISYMIYDISHDISFMIYDVSYIDIIYDI